MTGQSEPRQHRTTRPRVQGLRKVRPQDPTIQHSPSPLPCKPGTRDPPSNSFVRTSQTLPNQAIGQGRKEEAISARDVGTTEPGSEAADKTSKEPSEAGAEAERPARDPVMRDRASEARRAGPRTVMSKPRRESVRSRDTSQQEPSSHNTKGNPTKESKQERGKQGTQTRITTVSWAANSKEIGAKA